MVSSDDHICLGNRLQSYNFFCIYANFVENYFFLVCFLFFNRLYING